jgi:heterotetrameric sarcosine oxidase gamma subunit
MRCGSLLSLRTRPAPWLDRLAAGLSQLPPCRQLPQGQALWMRLGPDEWWCWWDQDMADTGATLRAIEEAAQGAFHACVDLSDAHAACLLPAPAEPLMSAGCDLDLERLPADFAGRTRLAAFTVVVAQQAGQPGALRLWIESSLAQSLGAWLVQTAALQRR